MNYDLNQLTLTKIVSGKHWPLRWSYLQSSGFFEYYFINS